MQKQDMTLNSIAECSPSTTPEPSPSTKSSSLSAISNAHPRSESLEQSAPGPYDTRSQHEMTVYAEESEKVNSEYQVKWINVMELGNYKTPSFYQHAAVLLLSWEKDWNDLECGPEVEQLKHLFEQDFRYDTKTVRLKNDPNWNLQIKINRVVAEFVDEHDGPNTLLIVYYAGHGKPGRQQGDLEIAINSASPNVKNNTSIVIWNKAEAILRDARAEILQIFDCCYAASLGRHRGDDRHFDYIAACDADELTPYPGPDSFTSSLIWSLKKLVKERPRGRFTTSELYRTIKYDAPNFPRKQNPKLYERREERNGFPAGRVMLHPLARDVEGGESQNNMLEGSSQIENASGPQEILTLNFVFSNRPSTLEIETLGKDLNDLVRQGRLKVDRIAWGGLNTMGWKAINIFQRALQWNRKHKRTLSEKQQPQLATIAQQAPRGTVQNPLYIERIDGPSSSEPVTKAPLGSAHNPIHVETTSHRTPVDAQRKHTAEAWYHLQMFAFSIWASLVSVYVFVPQAGKSLRSMGIVAFVVVLLSTAVALQQASRPHVHGA